MKLFNFMQVRPFKRSTQDKTAPHTLYYPAGWSANSKLFAQFVFPGGEVDYDKVKDQGATLYANQYKETAGFKANALFLDKVFAAMQKGEAGRTRVEALCSAIFGKTLAELLKNKAFDPYLYYLWDTALVKYKNKNLAAPSIPTCAARIKAIQFINAPKEIAGKDLKTLIFSTLILPVKVRKPKPNDPKPDDPKPGTTTHPDIIRYENLEKLGQEIRTLDRQRRVNLEKKWLEVDKSRPKTPSKVIPPVIEDNVRMTVTGIDTEAGTAEWKLSAEDTKKLSPNSQKLIQDLNLDAANQTVGALLKTVKQEQSKTYAKIHKTAPSDAFTKVGTHYIPQEQLPGNTISLSNDFSEHYNGTKGTVKPLGVGDLYLTEDKLLGYEEMEISYIENIMLREYKERVHRTFDKTETTYFTETVSESEESSDLEKSERYEMQKEVQTTLDSANSFSAGLNVSAKYGPVEVSANADYAVEHAESISTSTATDYAQDIVEKTTTRILESKTEQFTQVITSEIEETNTHGFDNKEGTQHEVGIYRYLDKKYRADLYNYGKRMMFEFLVPEPAALYFHALAVNDLEGVTLTPPPGIKGLSPDKINENNYLSYVKDYQAEGVNPPPEEYITLAKAIHHREPVDPKDKNDYKITTLSDNSLTVPDGYTAEEAWVYATYTTYEGLNAHNNIKDGWNLNIWLCRRSFYRNSSGTDSNKSLGSETGTLPIAIESQNLAGFAANIEVLCERTPEKYEAWKLETYQAILNAYNAQNSAYLAQIASAQAKAKAELTSYNSSDIERIQQDELKRNSLVLLTNQHFAGFDATRYDIAEPKYPELHVSQAMDEGSYAQFFQQAFEWENMVYEYYPYFWGRKSEWLSRIALQHSDPNFQAFLKAGMARVLVPVRPFYEQALIYFLENGEPWSGGEAPVLEDELYVSIIEDLSQDALEGEKTLVSSWEYSLPTNLVILQEGRELPTWE